MTRWYEGILVSYDCETSGVNVEEDRIVTAAVSTINPSAGSVHTDEWLINPEIDIPAEATAVHGITTEMARTAGRPADEAIAEIVSTLTAAWNAGLPVIVYNAPFDVSLLDRELRRHYHGNPLAPGYVIDPLCLDKQYDKYRKGSRKLVDVAKQYGIVLSELDAHGASADALASARVAWKLAKKYPQLGEMPLDVLHAKQVGWFAEQATSLGQYFARQGKTDHVPTEWPIRPVPVVAS